jgi:hypothetical protein
MVSLVNYVKSTLKKYLPKRVIFLDYGNNLIIPVYGEHYAQDSKQKALKKLYKEHKSKIIEFSLAPQDDYQKRAQWPEEPFLNVLPRGEFTITKDNWIGYIAPARLEDCKDSAVRQDRRKYTKKIIELGKLNPVIIKGKIIKEGTEYSVILFASHKEIDKYLEELR